MADNTSFGPMEHLAKIACSRKREGSGDMQSIKDVELEQAKAFRLRAKRHRGKRKSRKECRRRVRPGKSRSRGLVSLGAPFNDNNFLISQRNLEGGEPSMCRSGSDPASPRSISKVCSLPRNESTCPYEKVKSWRNAADHNDNRLALSIMPTIAESTSPFRSTSDMSAETSDYSSLGSPICLGTSEHELEADDGASISYNSDEIFDEEFEMRNFEAEYSAQQQELREELLKIPRHELEDRYFFLLDQARMLEEKKEERRKMEELKVQVQDLVEENRRLRLDMQHSCTSTCQVHPAELDAC